MIEALTLMVPIMIIIDIGMSTMNSISRPGHLHSERPPPLSLFVHLDYMQTEKHEEIHARQ